MKPGGLLFVTVPALQFFWSRNDDVTGHRRRYSRQDLRSLAQTSGFSLLFSRYFMFFLSPIYFLQRFFGPKYRGMTRKEIEEKIAQVYKSPSRPVNTILGAVFALETPLGHWIPFPWGTSVMGVFQKKTGDG